VRHALQVWIFLGLAIGAPICPAQVVRVAAASDLQFAMAELSAKSPGNHVSVTYGSSGNFYAQILNGAPFDLFFSADVRYPEKLVEAGLAEPASLYIYGRGRLVIWAPAGAHLALNAKGFAALEDPRVQKIAIAHPEHAPYGRAAVEALKKAGIYEEVRNKLVYGENIAQAAQFVQSRNAQAGILALSLAIAEPMQNGERWLVPAELHAPLEQAVVLLRGAANRQGAEAFLNFVKSEAGRTVLQRCGFTLGTE